MTELTDDEINRLLDRAERAEAELRRIRAEAAAPEAEHWPQGGAPGCAQDLARKLAAPLAEQEALGLAVLQLGPGSLPPQPPPRTRAEVDAEIATLVRARTYQNRVLVNFSVDASAVLRRLCREPTRPTPAESPAITNEVFSGTMLNYRRRIQAARDHLMQGRANGIIGTVSHNCILAALEALSGNDPAESPAIAAAERAVLDALAALSDEWLTPERWCTWRNVCAAELARRAAARGTEDT